MLLVFDNKRLKPRFQQLHAPWPSSQVRLNEKRRTRRRRAGGLSGPCHLRFKQFHRAALIHQVGTATLCRHGGANDFAVPTNS
ncbi:hypothetical protein XFF6166_610021 [Xanthomonas citri pv. fuscans]|nr:hypothetical protein XFF6166_610021 [Xanthomonas citri pv. fuscans]SOO43316.1 hypothetical protein XFF1815_330152 [Xanthomonas citri pv. fuscans]